ncbi:MAG: HEAT repeat domain-containing protein, partial [Planctomycetota bacterium]
MGLLATALGLSLFASLPPHGGVYAPPPGPVLAPGIPGVRTLGPTVSSGPSTGAPTLASAPTTPGGSSGPDLALWTYWWQHNQAPFLNVKAHVRGVDGRTGSDGWFLGQGQKDQALSLRPSVPQVRDQIVPALLTVLEKESDSSLVSGALVALGKIGPDGSTRDAERFEAACVKLLADANQEVRETAALALGILGHGRAVPYLAHLLWDSKTAQRWVGAREVDYRTRAFAAFGLAQVGARSESTSERESIVKILREALAADETKTPDLAAACVIALGLVPLPEDEDGAAADPAAPRTGRAEQLEHLLAWFEDDEHHRTARAHCPTALARLCIEVRGPAAVALRARIANVLAERIERGKEPAEVLQSCVQALGTLATNGDGALDVRLRRALTLVDQRVSEPQARAFALMAMAEAGGRFGTDTPSGVGEARDFLVHELVFGKNALLPWSALGCGVLAWNLRGDPGQAAALESLQRAVRATLQDARAPERIGASALAAGL